MCLGEIGLSAGIDGTTKSTPTSITVLGVRMRTRFLWIITRRLAASGLSTGHFFLEEQARLSGTGGTANPFKGSIPVGILFRAGSDLCVKSYHAAPPVAIPRSTLPRSEGLALVAGADCKVCAKFTPESRINRIPTAAHSVIIFQLRRRRREGERREEKRREEKRRERGREGERRSCDVHLRRLSCG